MGTASPAPRPRPRTQREGRSVPVSQQPGNSFKYLYERLTEKKFQQLCGALLSNKYPGVTSYPVGMSDGGRDIARRSAGELWVYQVKWSSKALQDPVKWLKSAIDGEADNLRHLVREGATRYVLMTSVAGTSRPDSGSIDRLRALLDGLETDFGVPVDCLWQSDLDALVDAAPDSIKWSYQEMLAGSDAIRYLMHGSAVEEHAQSMRDTLLKVMATQWGADSRVKFSQADMDRFSIADLFIDVEQELVHSPREYTVARSMGIPDIQMGAIQCLLQATEALTLVLGEPGQGKSTLGQYLCQIHRAAILEPHQAIHGNRPEHTTDSPRLPLRLDLRDYAAWLSGRDPLADDEVIVPKLRPRGRGRSSLECFIADYCTGLSGGRCVTVEQVQDLVGRYPTLIVLDGLDEVAEKTARQRVVNEIDAFALRLGSSARPGVQLIVTTRPNSMGLPEPSSTMFETRKLSHLSNALQEEYLSKWSEVNGLTEAKRRELMSVFRSRAREDHIAQLATNPMQLTILLHLMQRRGESVPESRTPLYTSYLDTLLDREVTKSDIVREHRAYVEEVTAYLGWHMQAGVETGASQGRMPVKGIIRAMLLYLYEIEGPTELAETLFTAVTDRFWALSSKSAGTFEFSVQPMREYFAARFLAQYAGNAEAAVHKSQVLCHLGRVSNEGLQPGDDG